MGVFVYRGESIMLELPESYVLAEQFKETLDGKTILSATANSSPHGFAWYYGEPAEYNGRLAGKTITGSVSYGGRPEIWAEDMRISFLDGVRVRYIEPGEKRPVKHQLLLEFNDDSAICCSVQMYGGMLAFEDGELDDFYYNSAKENHHHILTDLHNNTLTHYEIM
jgi:formamidopyrimidine-DNA glycosylase